MPSADIPPQVRQFVRERINSVAQLELLLLLHTDPSRHRTAMELSEQLRVDPAWARVELQGMCEQGLIMKSQDPEPRWWYNAATPELDQMAKDVAQTYLLQRVSLIELIYSTPRDSTAGSLRALSDAFKLRRSRSNG